MIYILQKYCDLSEDYLVDTVWEVNGDIDKEYEQFLLSKAEERGIAINPHWLNMMDKNWHKEDTPKQFKAKEKEWAAILKIWTKENYLEKIMKGTRLEFNTIYI